MSQHALSVEDIAVVVAFKNEAAYLKACVESLLQASRGRAQLIFVDDGSTDDSLKVLLPYQKSIVQLSSDGSGPGKARNIAWKQTSKAFVAFLDADCIVPSSWLDDMVLGLLGKSDIFSSVGGRQAIYPEASQSEAFVATVLFDLGFVSDYIHTQNSVTEVLHNPTCNVLYDKNALLAAQGFDENFWPCEDLDLDLRLKKLGYKALYSPSLFVHHKRPDSFHGLCKMMNRYGFGHSKLVNKHGFCQPIHALPLAVLMVVFMSLGIFFISITYLILFWSLLVFVSVVMLSIQLKSFSKTLRYFPYVISMVISWVYGFFIGMFSRKKMATQHGK